MSTIRVRIVVAILLLINNYATQAQKKGNESPEWAKKAIWYQVFPERFRNGDISNDPKVEDIIGADPQTPPVAWNISPWTSDWYELQPWEQKNIGDNMYSHLLRRRYGGDLQGIVDKLDYLKDLGINAIYLNPIFISPSLHKYDGESYHHVDPNLGPDPAYDRELIKKENPLDTATWVWTKADKMALDLIKEAHRRNIRIIFDGVFNHMGYNSFAFKDVRKNQEASPYKDWFMIKSWQDRKAKTSFDYVGWFGVKSLPELKEDSLGIVDGPKQYIFNSVARWMNPRGEGVENGVDGWRLDVAFCVGHPFWKDFRKFVKEINPNAYLTAELVMKPNEVLPYVQGDEFDGEMNYNFAFACADFFFETKDFQISASQFDKRLATLREAYPKDVAEVSQNLFGSHDANRIGSHIHNRGIERYGNWGAYYNASMPVSNPNYNPGKPSEKDLALQKLFVIMQMTYVGAPMIYYGDEVGMWGGNDPDCRKPMVWDDMIYKPEVYNPDGSMRSKLESVEQNIDLLNFYKQLIAIKNSNPPLQTGEYATILKNNQLNIFAFERTLGEDKIIVCFNNGTITQKVEIPDIVIRGYQDLITNKTFKANRGKVLVEIKPKWGVILKEL